MRTTYEALPLIDILALANADAHDELIGLQVETLDADTDDTGQKLALEVSMTLPYRADMEWYSAHVDRCPRCTEGPVWDLGCPVGARLAKRAADAMCAQEDQAEQN